MPPAATLQLSNEAAQRVRSGHLWVHRRDITSARGSYENGSVVAVVDEAGTRLGRGLVNDNSSIVVRIWTRSDEPIDGALLRTRLDGALAYRRALGIRRAAQRIVNSEGDLLPGLTIDRYGDHLVVQVQSLGLERMRPDLAGWLSRTFPECRVYERSDTRARQLEGLEPLRGYWVDGEVRPPAGPIVVEASDEDGVRWFFDLSSGQKTGGFLDQRESQEQFAGLLAGRSVLDAFCNDGGFGVRALAAGAARVLFLDVSATSLERVRQNLDANGLARDASLVRMNVFDALRGFERRGARFDAVVLDPPAFTKSRRQLDGAYRGYKDINLRALRLMGPAGLLFTSSCSYHVSRDMFRAMFVDAARDAGRSVRIVEERGPGRDHPELCGMPETRYLKSIVAYVA